MKVSLIVIAAIAGLSVVSGCGGAIDEPSGDNTGDLGDNLENPTVGDPYIDVGVLGGDTGDTGDTGGTCDGCLPGDTGTGLWDDIDPPEVLECWVDAGLEDKDDVETGACTYSQGYWKTHPEEWPVAGLTIGDVWYERDDLIALMSGSQTSDASIVLLRQLVAALLNDGGHAQYTDADVDLAQQWMIDFKDGDGRLPFGISSGSPEGSYANNLAYQLARYNLGYMCAPHCANEFMDTSGLIDVSP